MMSFHKLRDDEIERFILECGSDNEEVDFDATGIEVPDGSGSDSENSESIAFNDETLHNDSSSSESSEVEEDEVPLNILKESINKSNVIKFSKSKLFGKNRHKWATTKPKSHKYGHKIIRKFRGPTENCKNITEPLDCFQMFITADIISEIVQWTNVRINANKPQQVTNSAQFKDTDSTEINALIGILALTAALPTTELFDATYCGSRYLAAMTQKRFNIFMSYLRFDDKAIRTQNTLDKFSAIRKIWDLFIYKCRENYTPGPYVTIDEQLLEFRGKSSFRMYIPNKPAKYGLKIVMLCDSSTKYMINAMPYLGKGSNTGNLPLGEFFVKELTMPIHGTNRNVTMDNWFTSVPLAKSLLNSPYNLSLWGTLRSNKREIPKEMGNIKGRKCNTSMFCYDNKLTLLSYKPKPAKIIYLLSSCDEKGTINEVIGKPYMIEFYNQTKGGVDSFDQMCSIMSCSRKTNRWPMCMFFGMLNMAFINSFVIYTHNMFAEKKPLSRRAFMKKLSSDLIKPVLTDRLTTPNLLTSTRTNIENVLSILNETISNTEEGHEYSKSDKKRSNCKFCPYTKRRMTKTVCKKCKKSMCGEHKVELCTLCYV